MSKNVKSCSSDRLGAVGGQAVLEGVMMKSKEKVALSVRDVHGNIKTEYVEFSSVVAKHKWINIPVLRGVVNFVETMALSMKTLNRSADMLGIEEEESKFEKWLTEKFGQSIAAIASVIGTVLGLLLAVGLFFLLPSLIVDFVKNFTDIRILLSIVDGTSKILIFIIYIALVSLIPDMRRTFEYHGAEHKSIFCHEAGLELTPENVKKQSRFHPRCGTSFLFVMMFISIIISMLYVDLPIAVRIPVKFLVLPFIVGVGYEFIKFAGRHNNLFVRILSAPGLWIQRLTTKEPDIQQIEVAIASLKAALPDIYSAENIEYVADEASSDKAVDKEGPVNNDSK